MSRIPIKIDDVRLTPLGCGTSHISDKHDSGIVGAAPFDGGLLAESLTEACTFDYRPAPAEVVSRARCINAVYVSFEVPLRPTARQGPPQEPVVRPAVGRANPPTRVRQTAADSGRGIPPRLWTRLSSEGLVDAA